MRGESSGEQYESNYDEADESADEKAKDERESIFLAAKILDQATDALRESRKSNARHCEKLRRTLPIPQRVKPIANPNVVGYGFDERNFLHEILVGQRVVSLIVGILNGFQTFADDVRDECERADRRKRALKLPAHLRWLQRPACRNHWKAKRDCRHSP